MGFSSGKSSAKRKAEQAEHDAYVNALKDVNRADEIGRQSTNNYRTVRDKVGEDNLDGYSKALLRKADSKSSKFNQNSGDINAAIGQYNERYDKLQRQFNGESIHDGYDVKVNDPNRARGGLMGAARSRYTKEFDTLDEANTFTPESSKLQQNGMGAIAGATQQNDDPNYLGFGQAYKPKPIQTEVIERTQTPITHYRGTLRASRDAYQDMGKLANSVDEAATNAGLDQYKSEYEVLQKRLQNSLRRSQGVVKPVNTGLIGEVITNNQSPIEAIRQAG